MKSVVNIPENLSSRRILVAPLDWGLGHYTRCIPLIGQLMKQNNEVFVAASGPGALLIQEAFPTIPILPISGYDIHYPKNGRFFFLSMIRQLPRLAVAVKKEEEWLQQQMNEYHFDIVISDNRLGMHTPDAHCVFITHQLAIQTGSNFLNTLVKRINYHFIEQFNECWVPDNEAEDNLSGLLSHPKKPPHLPIRYIGWLSRFHPNVCEKKYKLVFVISGPEPQRTIFENIIFKLAPQLEGEMVIVRGLPEATEHSNQLPQNITAYHHLAADQLSLMMQMAEWVVCRSGYSTLMDLKAIAQKAILVPTPGQTEQEYLAQYLSDGQRFVMIHQQALNCKSLLSAME